ADPRILQATDAIVRLSATCVCGSDLWPYRGAQPITEPTHMGHEYCGIVEEVRSEVRAIRTGQFVVGSFATSDNTCPNCRNGY
ncbi:IMP dehydrogenase, partial [Mesorhizobium sp. M2D.F.Ca.ET.140.01.1.1]|uniref:alcohol dehydrogenase catalytic domain-containing protein n=1 Tax=Mesorhizobium sp. M2D.F.Ca.ET.140.01.1.1 TaxID=2496664 RepID=UPI000FD1E81D